MRKVTALVAASCFLFLAAPAANADAGPGYAACKAATNAYELATGREAPWACMY